MLATNFAGYFTFVLIEPIIHSEIVFENSFV